VEAILEETEKTTEHASLVEERVRRFQRDGYLVIPDAIPKKMLDVIRRKFDALMTEHCKLVDALQPGARRIYMKRIIERDAVFEPLMDWPATFPIVRQIVGADVTLASAGEADCRPPRTGPWIGWHTDTSWMPGLDYPRQINWLRCAYFVDDITDDMGPFTLLPGSHRAAHPPPSALTGPNGDPADIEGAVRIVGKAGSCLINSTEIWHTSTPNRSDRSRKLLMMIYKHAWMRQWEDGHEISREFAERQTSPLRRQLCNLGVWHRYDWVWDA